MRRKWILGLVALTAVAGTAITATTVLGGGSEGRPGYATVEMKLQPRAETARVAAKGKKARKPTISYFTAQPAPINTSPPTAGGIGPNIDIEIGPCPGNRRVVEGGVVASDLGVDMQGTFVERGKRYHVLLEDEDTSTPTFTVEANLTCIKGVKQR